MGSEWQESTLGNLTEWSSGGTPPKSNPAFWGGGIPWISASSMKTGRLADSDRTLTSEGLERGSRLARKGDVLLLVRGSELHKRIPVGIASRDVSFNQDVKALRAKDSLNEEFLYYWLAGNETMLLSKVENTGIGAGKLDTNVLKSLTFHTPPKHEQRAIAHILGTLDDKIELNRRRNQTLEAMARALFKDWFVDFGPVRAKMEGRHPYLPADLGHLFPDSLDDEGKPEGWEIRPIYEFSNVVYGAPFASKQFNTTGSGIPLIRIRDLASHEPGVWTEQLHPKGHLIEPGDIVVGMDGEFRLHIWKGQPAWLNQRVCHFEPLPGVPSSFLVGALAEPLAFFERGKVGTTVIHLGKGDIDTFQLLHPGGEILDAFAFAAEPWVNATVRNELESRILARLRDTLLPKLISGELRIADAEKFLERLV
jgi:type I restriction enzyme S subunit